MLPKHTIHVTQRSPIINMPYAYDVIMRPVGETDKLYEFICPAQPYMRRLTIFVHAYGFDPAEYGAEEVAMCVDYAAEKVFFYGLVDGKFTWTRFCYMEEQDLNMVSFSYEEEHHRVYVNKRLCWEAFWRFPKAEQTLSTGE